MAPGLLEHGVIGVQGRANGQTFIACRRLDISATKGRAVEQLAVRDAVESTSARHRQIVTRDALVQPVQKMENHFLEPVLQRKGEIHVALRNLRVRRARLSEYFLDAIGEMTSQADRAIGQDLHPLIAAQRLEVGEIKL